MHRHTAIVLIEPHTLMVGDEAIRAEPLHGGVPQRQVHATSVNADLGHGVAGAPAPRLRVDELAEAVEEATLAVLDALPGQGLPEAERTQLVHGVRQKGNADTQLLHLWRALVYAAGETALLESECEREPADAPANDCDVHAAR